MENNRNKSEDELSKITGERANNRGVGGNLPGNDKSLTSNEREGKDLSSASREDRQNIAQDTGLNAEDISDIKDLGGLSGRDDYAGGNDVDMSNLKGDDIR